MVKKETSKNISASLEKLEGIVRWLDEQERVDVQEGLEKVKEGTALVKELKARLKEVENEYQEVKRDLETEDSA
jgi:exodeoxyribonuclease VII small subunit